MLDEWTLSLPGVISHDFLFQSLTRDVSYSMENLAFDSLLSWKLTEQSFLTTSLNHFFLNGWENLHGHPIQNGKLSLILEIAATLPKLWLENQKLAIWLIELYPFLESKKWYLLFKGILWWHDVLTKTSLRKQTDFTPVALCRRKIQVQSNRRKIRLFLQARWRPYKLIPRRDYLAFYKWLICVCSVLPICIVRNVCSKRPERFTSEGPIHLLWLLFLCFVSVFLSWISHTTRTDTQGCSAGLANTMPFSSMDHNEVLS